MKKVKREPCMTLAELSRKTGVTEAALGKRSKTFPLPPEVVFVSQFAKPQSGPRYKPRQFRKSELEQWYLNSTKFKENVL